VLIAEPSNSLTDERTDERNHLLIDGILGKMGAVRLGAGARKKTYPRAALKCPRAPWCSARRATISAVDETLAAQRRDTRVAPPKGRSAEVSNGSAPDCHCDRVTGLQIPGESGIETHLP
jgi:hypothetical protein